MPKVVYLLIMLPCTRAQVWAGSWQRAAAMKFGQYLKTVDQDSPPAFRGSYIKFKSLKKCAG